MNCIQGVPVSPAGLTSPHLSHSEKHQGNNAVVESLLNTGIQVNCKLRRRSAYARGAVPRDRSQACFGAKA
jgi:hypothetical protein